MYNGQTLGKIEQETVIKATGFNNIPDRDLSGYQLYSLSFGLKKMSNYKFTKN